MTPTMTALQYLTAERCSVAARSLQESVTRYGISLNAVSPMADMIKHLEWMGSFPVGPTMPGGACDTDRDRVLEVLPRVEQFERIAIALQRIRGLKGAESVVSCLTDNIDRLSTFDEKAQDVLFEIEVGGRLAVRGCPVAFAEPDIVLEFPRVPMGLPCKRPRGPKGIIGNLRKAAGQLEDNQLAGVAVVSVEPIVHPPAPKRGLSDRKPAPKIWVAETQQELDEFADHMLREAIEPYRAGIVQLFARHPQLGGVVFCGVITAWLRNPSAYVYRWLSYPISNPLNEDTATVTDLLSYLIRGPHGQ